ncbi:MAG: hypothetical protein HW409_1200 [candidate division NC10 bacterium]|nr:hypothetical protein [candidate division NC10 bacterium]
MRGSWRSAQSMISTLIVALISLTVWNSVVNAQGDWSGQGCAGGPVRAG